MTHYRYLIVGGGMAAAAAVEGIRQVDPQGSIGLIGAESHRPYNRPPLSKGLWKGKPLEKIYCRVEAEGVEMHLGCRAESIDIQGKSVQVDRGPAFTYDKLLLATGGSPRRLPGVGDRILYFRTLDDYLYLRERSQEDRRFAVIGCGFIGTELAAVLARAGREVTMLSPDPGVGARLFPPDLVDFLNGYYRERGVRVLANELVESAWDLAGKILLRTQSGQEIEADEAVAGIGIRPEADLAETAGIKIEDGIWVDKFLQTSRPDIYAAGDVASFYNPALDKRLRVEHEDNATQMGLAAGRNMAGERLPYHHLPHFYSDLFDLKYDAVGELNPELETFADWQEPYQKGVVYYLKEGRVRGVLLMNIRDQLDAARRLIAEPGPFGPRQLKGRLPE